MSSERIHPRPQLARAKWSTLNGTWEFATDPEDLGLGGHWEHDDTDFPATINVPFPPESPASGVRDEHVEIVWYRYRLTRDRPIAGRRLILHFAGVDYRADVWVNGQHVASHEGGSIGFDADISDVMNPSGTQTIVVRAHDEIGSLEQPRGKQDWERDPHVIWYRRTTGIWREVWIEEVAHTHLASITWTPTNDPARVRFEARVNSPQFGDTLTIQLSVDGTTLARTQQEVFGQIVQGELHLTDTRLSTEPDRLQWSPERPVLIDAQVALRRHGDNLDEVTSYFGIRTVGVDDRSFLLNSRPYFLRLVLEQAYWPESHLAAPNDDALREEVELIKSLGFNGIRMHQVAADPRMLYWCDRLGLLVWADAAASFSFSTVSYARTVREWLELVARDINHPSIVAWVPFNESWGVPRLEASLAQQNAVRGVTHMLKALDPSRLVLGNDGWEYTGGDILGVHDYTQSASELTERFGTEGAVAHYVAHGRAGGRPVAVHPDEARGVPVVLSEFGGLSLSSSDDTWEGYGRTSDEAEFLDALAAQLNAVHTSALAGFCYTQLTDTVQERNGLLTETRRPKAPIAKLAAIITGQPVRVGSES